MAAPIPCNSTELISRINVKEWTDIKARFEKSIAQNPKINRQALFENIDLGRYKSNSKSVTFRTSAERMLVWVYTLCLRYHDLLGDSDDYEISWTDKPDDGESNENPSLFVETKIVVKDKRDKTTKDDGVKLFCITVYYTTCTIFVQGNMSLDFAKQEFPGLKETVQFLMEAVDDLTITLSQSQEPIEMNVTPQINTVNSVLISNSTDEGDTYVDAIDIDITKAKTLRFSQDNTEIGLPGPPDTKAKTLIPSKDNTEIGLPEPDKNLTSVKLDTEKIKNKGKQQFHSHDVTQGVAPPNSEKYLKQIAECLCQFASVKDLVSNMESTLVSKLFEMKDTNSKLEIEMVKRDLSEAQIKEKQATKEANVLRQENHKLQRQLEEFKKNNASLMTNTDSNLIQELRQQLSNLHLEFETVKSDSKRKITVLEDQYKLYSNLKVSLEAEANTLMDRVKDKDSEIVRLERKNKDLTLKCEKLADEIISLKIHDSRDRVINEQQTVNRFTSAEQSPTSRNNRSAEEIGLRGVMFTSSIGKQLRMDKLLREIKFQKKMTYTINEAKEALSDFHYSPQVAVLQVLSNEVKDSNQTVDTIVDRTVALIKDVNNKWPECKVVLSLPPPRMDNERLGLKSDLLCAKLKSVFFEDQSVSIADHKYMDPCSDEYENDKLHPNMEGTKRLATGIRRAVIKALGLKGGRRGSQRGDSELDNQQSYGLNPRWNNHSEAMYTTHDPFQRGPWRRGGNPWILDPQRQRWNADHNRR